LLRYFNQDDSGIKEDEVENILNLRSFKTVAMNYKVFISEWI